MTVAGRDPARRAHALAAIGGRAQLDSFFARHPPADDLVVAVPADRGGGPFAQLDQTDIAAALKPHVPGRRTASSSGPPHSRLQTGTVVPGSGGYRATAVTSDCHDASPLVQHMSDLIAESVPL